MIEVTERKQVCENCSTCLYGPGAIGWNGEVVRRFGCGHADRQGDWLMYSMGTGGRCPSYWLDHRFERV